MSLLQGTTHAEPRCERDTFASCPSQFMAGPPGAACPHEYAADRAELVDYCSYTRLPDLLALWPARARTADEKLLCALLMSFVLWGSVARRELLAVSAADDVIAAHEGPALVKRLDRCRAIADVLRSQLDIADRHLLRGDVRLGFRLLNTEQWPPITELMSLCNPGLRSRIWFVAPGPPADRATIESLQQRVAQAAQWATKAWSSAADALEELFERLPAEPDAVPLEIAELIPVAEIEDVVLPTLRLHHPHVLESGLEASNDEFTFITSHLVPELWFVVAIDGLTAAVSCLTDEPANVVAAADRVSRAADVMQLFCQMIQMPQTMTAADYLAFRQQLRGGSGAESIDFRALEIRAGLRDTGYLNALESSRLMTDELRALRHKPSLNSAFLAVARRRGIVKEPSGRRQRVRDLAQILKPTAAFNAHADLAFLAEAMLDFEQAFDRWRVTHLQMVDRMIGNQRPSMGLAGQSANGDGSDSRPYLLRTLTYDRMFPELWEARQEIQEQPSPTQAELVADQPGASRD
jgi:tryptophan 2,3-dioxygenase